MFYRSPAQIQPPPQSRFKRYSGKLWYFCVRFKIRCSLWMLLTFAVLMIYFNDNYMNLTISLPSTKFLYSFASSSSTPYSSAADFPYLHPNAYHSSYGTCPYTTPTYPNIGPDLAYICPAKKPYRIGAAWYLKEDLFNNRDESDREDVQTFFDTFNRLKHRIENGTDYNADIKRIKRSDGLHLTYLYTSCQTEKEVKTIHDEWDNIVNTDNTEEYDAILQEYGYKSWGDVKVCFDSILCMNDNYLGGVTYNLYLDKKSQEMMFKLIHKTEEIQENKFNVDLTFKREINQQSFHITLGTFTNSKDYDLFDGKQLMDIMNGETKGKFPCIRLTKEPPIQNYICKNTNKLSKTSLKFDWHCTDVNV